VMHLLRRRVERPWPTCETIGDIDHRDRVGHARGPPELRNPMASTTTKTLAAKSVPPPPVWIKPHLAALVKAASDGSGWLNEIKFDGYRMHAQLNEGRVNILTRRGNDWTRKYPAIAADIARLRADNAYLDGELCGVLPDGRTAFNLIQNASD